MPHLDIDTTRRVVFLKGVAGYLIHNMKCWTSTNISELILANTDILLPSNQLTGQTQRG